jgi:CDP-glucose 4,6-dehydratase
VSVWRGRRVLVTGASGFLGSWLTRDLVDAGARVVALASDGDPRAELVRSGTVERVVVVDALVEDLDTLCTTMERHQPDTVFHLAAQTQVQDALRDPLTTFESNVRGTYVLLEACRRFSAPVERIVIASSDKAYGDAAALPYTEETTLEARFPYDTSKLCTDVLSRSYVVTYGLPLAIARCGNIYGGGDLNWDRLVPGTIRSLLRGERPVIRSNGQLTRDYVYVRDVVDAYLTLAEHVHEDDVRGRAFNFSAERPLSVLAVVEAIVAATGVRLEPDVRDEAQAEIKDQYLSSALARRVLRWEPHWRLDEALRETVAWYRDFLGDAP